MKDFTGKTKEGITLGASLEEIEKAYGQPPQDDFWKLNQSMVVKGGCGVISYPELGLTFSFQDHKVAEISVVSVEDPTGSSSGPEDPGNPTRSE